MPFCMVPVADAANPIVAGSFQPWGGWLWFVWRFHNNWQEWIPAYPFILAMVNFSFVNTFQDATSASAKIHQQLHALMTFRSLHEDLVLGYALEGEMVEMVEEQILYLDR